VTLFKLPQIRAYDTVTLICANPILADAPWGEGRLKTVALDSKTTALLVLDILKQNCGPHRPRSVAMLQHVKTLLDRARAEGTLIVYSAFPGAQISDTVPDIAPLGGEPTVLTCADKFFKSDLDEILKTNGIASVVVTGIAAHGAVLHTASDAAARGYSVVVPVDCMASATPYIEQYAIDQLTNGAPSAERITLTQADMVTFQAS